MNVSLRTKALLILLGPFLLWNAWLMVSLGTERNAQYTDLSVAERLEDIEKVLADMRQASVATADLARPDSQWSRWHQLYVSYRETLYKLDRKSPSVYRINDDLVDLYTYETTTNRIRQKLIRGGLQPEEARQLESEFRSNINLALAAVRHAQNKLRYPPERVPAAQRAGIYVALGSAFLLTLLAAGLLIFTDKYTRRMREAERRLNEALSRGGSVEETIHEAIFTLDDQGLIRAANPAAEKMFGGDAEEFIGRDIRDFVPDVFSMMHAGVRELSAYRNNGGEFPVDCEMKRVPLQRGTLLLAFLRDVTDRVRAETPLSAAQRMDLSIALAGRFAHNFNNVLTAIAGYADLLTYSVDEKDPMHKDLEEIKKASDRAASLTAQMLAFSGKQVLRVSDVELNPLVSRAVRGCRPLVGDKIVVQSSIDPSVGSVKADPEQIEQVILKLAVNARDAMPGGGKLFVHTASMELNAAAASRLALKPGDYAVVEVRDTGTGMDGEVLSHLFEPFFTTKNAGRGMGLGLPSSWGVVRQFGGVIRADSSPGKGSTFRVYLPQQRAAGKPASARVISALFRERTGLGR